MSEQSRLQETKDWITGRFDQSRENIEYWIHENSEVRRGKGLGYADNVPSNLPINEQLGVIALGLTEKVSALDKRVERICARAEVSTLEADLHVLSRSFDHLSKRQDGLGKIPNQISLLMADVHQLGSAQTISDANHNKRMDWLAERIEMLNRRLTKQSDSETTTHAWYSKQEPATPAAHTPKANSERQKITVNLDAKSDFVNVWQALHQQGQATEQKVVDKERVVRFDPLADVGLQTSDIRIISEILMAVRLHIEEAHGTHKIIHVSKTFFYYMVGLLFVDFAGKNASRPVGQRWKELDTSADNLAYFFERTQQELNTLSTNRHFGDKTNDPA